MKPFSDIYQIGLKERVFNYSLSRRRRVVKNIFGITFLIFVSYINNYH